MIDPKIPQPLQDLVKGELDPGETVVWSAMPKLILFNKLLKASLAIALVWICFVEALKNALTSLQIIDLSDVGFSATFGIPVCLVAFVTASTVAERRRQSKTVYAITNRRAILFDGGSSIDIRSYPPEKLTDVFRREHSDGTGDVLIVREAWRNSDGDSHMRELGFLRIHDAKKVEEMLKALAKQAEPQA